jgi:hypothetical protein
MNLQKEVQNLHKYSTKVSEQSITWSQGKPQSKPEACSIYLPRTKWLKGDSSALGDYLRSQKCRVHEYFFPIDISAEDARRLARRSDTSCNIVISVNNRRHEGQRNLLRELGLKNKEIIVISGGYPRDWIPGGTAAAVIAYWTSPSALLAAAKVIFGKQKARGRMPLLGSAD